MSMSEDVGGTREGFESVTEFVERNLHFATSHYNDSYLQRRIKSRMRRTRTENYREYLELLQSDEEEHQQLLDALSINVTGFFRNPDVWDGIRSVLEEKAATSDQLRIWSAACADGREPYSLAMLALDDPAIDDEKVSIIGSDINERALNLAREGVYESNHTSDLAEQLQYLDHNEAYVDRSGDEFRVRDEVKELVTLEKHDLIRDEATRTFEVVVCRNLFIYIDTEFKQPIIASIRDSLVPDGNLIIGKAETLPPSTKPDFEVVDGRKRIYRKV